MGAFLFGTTNQPLARALLSHGATANNAPKNVSLEAANYRTIL